MLLCCILLWCSYIKPPPVCSKRKSIHSFAFALRFVATFCMIYVIFNVTHSYCCLYLNQDTLEEEASECWQQPKQTLVVSSFSNKALLAVRCHNRNKALWPFCRSSDVQIDGLLEVQWLCQHICRLIQTYHSIWLVKIMKSGQSNKYTSK